MASADDDVEVLLREGDGRQLLFVMNYSAESREVALMGKRGVDLLTGEACDGTVVVVPRGTRIIKLEL